VANQYFVFKPMPKIGTQFTIENQSVAHHIFNVMRVKTGDELRLVFDDAQLGLAEVVNSDNQTVKLIDKVEDYTELPVNVTLAVGFPKGDKLDFIVEKSTELGASSIWSAPFHWSVAKWDSKKLTKKQEKLEKIALGAAEQSQRLLVPTVKLFEKLSDLTEKFTDFDHVLIAYEESAKSGEHFTFIQTLEKLKSNQNILVLFGPEGGISQEEIESFEKLGAIKIGLGPRIMRAETAPLYVLSAVSAYLELQKNS